MQIHATVGCSSNKPFSWAAILGAREESYSYFSNKTNKQTNKQTNLYL